MQWEFYQDWWWNLGLVAIIAYVSIQGYAQPQMVPIHFEDSEVADSEEGARETSSTDPQWDKALMKAMEEEKVYLNPELTLSSLAKKVELTPLQTSEVINGVHGSNFNEYVNGFRVAHFKEEVVKPENKALTLLAVALDSGFNSKATFNRVFKKIEGVSPKEYVTQHS
jgi:YesN/AraC family two-component response regulator